MRDAMFDPFEYLMLRHKDGKLKTDFKNALGKVAYQVENGQEATRCTALRERRACASD